MRELQAQLEEKKALEAEIVRLREMESELHRLKVQGQVRQLFTLRGKYRPRSCRGGVRCAGTGSEAAARVQSPQEHHAQGSLSLGMYFFFFC